MASARLAGYFPARQGNPLKRSGGVIASAVLGFTGSGFSILYAAFFVISSVMVRSPPALQSSSGLPAPAAPPVAFLLMISLFYVALGTWGIVSSVGILRLRNWARTCFLVFAGLLSIFSIFGAIGSLMGMLVAPKIIPPQQHVPAGLMSGVFLFFLLVALFFTALGVSWLVYFSRPSVKAQFLGEVNLASPRTLPLSLTVISWILILGSLAMLFGLLLGSYPIIILGFVLHGWPGRIVLIAWGSVSFLVGAGMLRRRPEAHSLAVGYQFFGLLNLASYLFFGSAARAAIMQQIPQNPAINIDSIYPLIWFGALVGLVGAVVPLWFLITRRQAYLNACRLQSETSA